VKLAQRKMHPEVSVIIPTYNRRAMVREAVASVVAQSCASRRFGIEVIVVDDGSTDGTAEELELLAGEVNAEGAGAICVTVVRTENRGVAAARNTGVAKATAPLIAFLDSDDLWLPHKLDRQMAFMDAHPDCAIAQTEEIWMRGGRRVNPGVRHRKRAGDIFAESLRTCLISPSAVILRTGLFREAGGFDERMLAAEDYDLWLRILANHQVGLIAEPLVMRRAGHPGQLSATVPAIDRFRLLALLKLLDGDQLERSRRRAVEIVIEEKCAIYAQGLRRRGREADAIAVTEMAARATIAGADCERVTLSDSIASLLTIIGKDASGTAGRSGLEASDEFAKVAEKVA
jgi:glycosyltransferase involved in cell wall biosynthesis